MAFRAGPALGSSGRDHAERRDLTRPMRPLRLVAIAGLAAFTVLAIAACSAGATPGWTYAPAPPATPTPSPAASASAAPSAAASPSSAASPAASAGGGGTVIDETAQNIQFQTTSLQAPANQPFQIQFHNADAGVPHNIAIEDGSGTVVFKGDIITGVTTKTYDVPALAPGTYKFVCQIHPNMVGTLTVGP